MSTTTARPLRAAVRDGEVRGQGADPLAIRGITAADLAAELVPDLTEGSIVEVKARVGHGSALPGAVVACNRLW
jgi:hypothetical protein